MELKSEAAGGEHSARWDSSPVSDSDVSTRAPTGMAVGDHN